MKFSTLVTMLGSCLLGMVVVTGCVSFGEPPAVADATPPAGYAPVFLKRVAPLPVTKPNASALQLTGIDVRDMKNVGLTLHLVDSSGTFYTQPDVAQIKKMICKVTDVLGDDTTVITKYNLSQSSELTPVPLAVALVMDNSGSMGEERARAVQDAAFAFIAKKAEMDGLALVRYDHHVQVEVPLTKDAATLSAGLKRNGLWGFGGGTAILSGSAEAIAHLDANAAGFSRKAVIVFTDGQENSSSIKREQLIEQSLRTAIPVCAVDFGNGINKGYMEDLARATGGFYQHIYRTREFEDLFEDVYRRLRNSYKIEYPNTGYGKHTVTVTLCWGKDTLQAVGSYDNTPEPGRIALLDVYFDTGKATLTAASKRAIKNVTSMMNAMPNMQIELRGHTDSTNNTGDPNFNNTLSQQRADAVKEALVKNGIGKDRITAKGFGDTAPLDTNTTEEGRARNRRTEFVITRH
ncbi:MAG: OmpA family protein [Bradyrhizobiaceae bacterium]|nr:OmpA family protein [Bradyrhizobiaceae bacterium]